MTIGKPSNFLSGRNLRESLAQWGERRKRDRSQSRRGRSASARQRRASIERRLQTQSLEARQLLAGPELIGIQPNSGELIREGTSVEGAPIFGTSLLLTAPNELTFRFDDNSEIDPATLLNPITPQDSSLRPLGLSITRAGADGSFETATAVTDFNTGGIVELEFRAATGLPGVEGNGTQVVLTSVNLPLTTAPVVVGPVTASPDNPNKSRVTIQLNTNAARPAQVRDIALALAASPANDLVRAIQISGSALRPIGAQLPAGGLTLTLDGANAARIETDLGLGPATELRIIANQSGPAGTDLRVALLSQNFGGAAPPQIRLLNQTIEVRLNSSPGNQTTIGELVEAINDNPTVSDLVTASLQRGSADQLVGGQITPSPGSNALVLPLTGASDTVVTPGFVGLGDRANEVVFRFAEPLPEDTYQIEIYGQGDRALLNLDGDAFNDGQDFAVQFDIDTPPRVLAVVPEPISEVGGRLISEPNIVEVYFTDDIRVSGGSVGSVLNPDYYKAIYTQDTVTGNDDRVVEPIGVELIPGRNDAVRVIFGSPFSRLPDPNNAGQFEQGAVRLRVGDESLLPNQLASRDVATSGTVLEPGDSIFADASQAGALLIPEFNGFDTTRATGIRLTGGEIRNTTPFELQFPGGTDFEGVRNIRPDDPSRNTRTVPLGIWRDLDPSTDFIGDETPGISTIYYNFPDSWQGEDFNTDELDLEQRYINSITEQQRQRVREVASLFSEYLGIQFIEVGQDAAEAISAPGFVGLEGQVFSIAVGELQGATSDDSIIVNGSAPGGLTSVLRPLDDRGDTFLGITPNTDGNGVPIPSDNGNQLIILDAQDFDASTDDFTGGEFFRGAFLAIGQLLGYGNADHLPQPITQSAANVLDPTNVPVQDQTPATTDDLLAPNEPIFPAPADIVNGQFLYRPESNDVDLYRFTLANSGTLEVSTIAERLSTSSQLDTMLRLYRIVDGVATEIAANDDYFSNDSLVELHVEPGTYAVGVSASGNDRYDPNISGTGLGGVSEGEYEIAMTFTPSTSRSITDQSGQLLDGDADGEAGGLFHHWFEPNDPNTTLYIDNTGSQNTGTPGSITAPYRTLNEAFNAVEARRDSANPVKVVRVVGDGTYRIGSNSNGGALTNGEVRTINVPRNVNLVLDGGVRFEMQGSRIGVGSTTTGVDRSGATLQILGTPDNPVELVGTGVSAPGTWGGIELRGDIDFADDSRENLENLGIFLNHIQFADIRGAGGQVSVDGVTRRVSAIELAETRATIINSSITESADAAIAATPNTFLETRFDEARFQTDEGTGEFFTSDFDRIGPHIRGNTVIENTYNGLLVRIDTPSGGELETLTVNARFDDTDIVHILNENLLIEGTPGGAVSTPDRPSLAFSSVTPSVNLPGQRLGNVPQGDYVYRMTFVTQDGFESIASDASRIVSLSATGRIDLTRLPIASASEFSGRRLYRAPVQTDANGVQTVGEFTRIARLNTSDTTFRDTQLTGSVPLSPTLFGANSLAVIGRLDPGLTIDPGTIIKLDGARIDVTFDARLFAEGTQNEPIVMTSLNDRRFGTGGTFNTSGQFQDSTAGALTTFGAGDWSGIFVFAGETSFDHVTIAGAGGVSQIEGGFASFNAIESHQSDLRIANSRFENNAGGREFVNDSGNNINNPNDPREQRVNRVNNAIGTVFVRGSQPTIINNVFVDGDGPALSFDVNSFTWQEELDPGRSTGPINALPVRGNSGPLIQGNHIDGGLAGLEIRGGTVATEVVWDDTDIVHIVRDTISIPNQHIYGGLRLESDARGSLVVKFDTLGDTPEQTLFVTGATGPVLPADLPVPGDVDFFAVGTLTEPGLVTFAAGVGADVEVGEDFITVTITEPEAGSFSDEPFDGLQFSPQFDLGTFNNATVDRFGTTLQGFGPDNLTIVNGSLFLNTSGLDFRPGDVIRISTNEIFPIPEIPFQPDPLLRQEAAIVVGGNLYTAEDQFTGIADRIGGSLQVIGRPDFPVVLTGITDDGVGAGFTSDGRANLDTDGNGIVEDRRTGNSTALGGLSDWHGIVIREAASDANVSITSENEPANVGNSDTNSITSRAQFLGELAPSRKDGDENQRIGLIVDGEISSRSDVDVYSFTAEAGTQVWIDIDRTDMSLDTVIELVNSNGQTIVLSDDSMEEAMLINQLRSLDPINPATAALFSQLTAQLNQRTGRGAEALDADSLFGLGTGQFDAGVGIQVFQDQYSVNPRDAGMRVILPGFGGVETLYHVRVRSAVSPQEKTAQTADGKSRLVVGNTSDVANDETTLQQNDGRLRRGLTSGSYQLQIRIEESDVHPGTQINFSDVMFAENGVQVIGGPLSGPLTGEDYENDADTDGDATTDNGTLAGAQRLGLFDTQFVGGTGLGANQTVAADGTITIARDGVDIVLDNPSGPLGSSQLAKNINGFIDGTDDVDWYEFEINYPNLTASGAQSYLSTVFDLDYSDGLGRADLSLHVFNALGELVLIGGDSNIADDIVLPGTGGAFDLSRGSFGNADPFIGSAELPEGTYFVAVSNQGQIPPVLDQFTTRDATNPLIRLEPIDSTIRVAEHGFGTPNEPGLYSQTAQGPITPVLFDDNSIIEQSFDDVFLYVNTNNTLQLLNPFTGTRYAVIGDFDGEIIEDIAFRANGELFAYTQYPVNAPSDDGWAYVRINTADGTIDDTLTVGGDGLITFSDNLLEVGENGDIEPQILDEQVDVGLSVEAITIRALGGNEVGFLVANRPDDPDTRRNLQYHQNIVYAFDDETGEVTGSNSDQRIFNNPFQQVGDPNVPPDAAGAGTNIRELGFIDTERDAQTTVLGLRDATEINDNGVVVPQIEDGDTFTLADGNQTATFEYEQGVGFNVLDVQSVSNGTVVQINVTGQPPLLFELTNTTPINPNAIVVNFNRSLGSERLNESLAQAISNENLNVISKGTQLVVPDAFSTIVTPPFGGNLGGIEATGTNGITPGNIAIEMFPTDTALALAQRTALAVQGAINRGELNAALNAVANNRSVVFQGALVSTTGGLVAGGGTAGGQITGVEIGRDPNTGAEILFAVSDEGRLYSISNAAIQAGGNSGNIGFVVPTATDLLGLEFTGLRAGPNSVEGSRFSNLLFATTVQGRLYAFNTAGELQNVFAGGQSSIQLEGVFNPQGLDFATLDFNLWHVTGARAGDPGHGINDAFHRGRPDQGDGVGAVSGNNSLAFHYTAGAFNGNFGPNEQPVQNLAQPGENVRQDGQAVQQTYNFPGGARGTVQSNTFSLAGFSAQDLPTMYFNYFLETDGVDNDANDPLGDPDLFGEDRDTLRVYVVDSRGVEHLVATNNESRGGGDFDDEFDDPAREGIYDDNIDVEVQQLFDNTGDWRQARVPLGEFAGQEGLSLRIEFSTAGTTSTETAEIRTVAGSELIDGQSFTIGGESFQIDLASTIVFPSGPSLVTIYGDPNDASNPVDPNVFSSFTIDGQTYVLDDGLRNIPADAIAIDITNGQPLSSLTAGQISSAVANSFDRSLALNRVVPSGLEIGIFYQDNPITPGVAPQQFYNENLDALVSLYINETEFILVDGDTQRDNLTFARDLALDADRVLVDVLDVHNALNPDDPEVTDIFELTSDDIAAVIADVIGLAPLFDEFTGDALPPTIGFDLLLPTNDTLDTFYADPTARFVITFFNDGNNPNDSEEYVLIDTRRQAEPGQIAVLLGSNLLRSDLATELQLTVEDNTGVDRPSFRVVDNFNFSDPSDPVDPDGNVNPNPVNRRNDLIFEATPLDVYQGGGLVIRGSGTLGTTLPTQVINTDDVDLLSVQLTEGTSVTVLSQPEQPGVQNVIRFFDAAGAEVLGDNGPLAIVNDTRQTISFIAPNSGLFYIGISGPQNGNYSPVVEGSTTAAATGNYDLEISISEPLDIRNVGGTVEFDGILNVTTDPASPLIIRNDATTRVTALAAGSIPVAIGRDDTATEVAAVLRSAIATEFYSGDIALVPQAGSALRLPGLVDPDSDANLIAPFIFTADRYGDQFGGDYRGGAFANASEGAYIDDVIIGFAERGELVTNSDPIDPNAAFVDSGDIDLTTPSRQRRDTDSGAYQLEIRDASEYLASGLIVDSPIDPGQAAAVDQEDARFRAFDTNERLASTGVSLTTRPASDILDGAIFTITGNNNRLTFEFDILDGVSNGIAPNTSRIAVTLDPEATAEDVADAIIARVNAPDVSPILGVIANRANLTEAGAGNTSNVPDRNVILLGADSILTSGAGTTAFERTQQGGLRGDTNRDRDEQGVILIENSRFLFNGNNGVEITRAATASVISEDVADATPSILPAVRNFDQLNTENLVPGVVVRNNTFAFNQNVGIEISGLDNGGSAAQNPIGFDRIVNNTLVGGSVIEDDELGSAVFGATFFPQGSVSFADSVIDARLGIDVEQSFTDPESALGSPDCHGISATDPENGLFTYSLGSGGSATFVFEDNLLTGSSSNPSAFIGIGDGIDDLVIFESGIPERIRVEVSRDNETFFNVGEVFGLNNTVDLDAFGFGLNDRFSFVRLTDLSPSNTFDFGAAGADIDAVGALSTVARDRFVPGQIGIQVGDNAAPALLNNIVSNFETGIQINPTPAVGTGLTDVSSSLTVIGGTTFFGNVQDTIIPDVDSFGQRAQFLSDFEEVFVDPANLVFTPQSRTPIIDSGLSSLEERASLRTLRLSIGVSPSPVLATDFDANGQRRVDDSSFDSGFGSGVNAFVDRGAQERTDTEGPRFVLTSPRGDDLIFETGSQTFGRSVTRGTVFDAFEVQFIDGIRPADDGFGVGVNDNTVTSENLLVTRLINGSTVVETLQEGVDYRFAYEPGDNTVRITPIAGIWTDNSVYTIEFLGGQAGSVDGFNAVLQAEPGITYSDGRRTFIDDSILENEVGIQLSIPRDSLTITNELTGIETSALDGQLLTINDGMNPEVVFEFVTDLDTEVIDGRLPFTGNVAIRLPNTSPPQVIARLLSDRINEIAAEGLLAIEAVFQDDPAAVQTGRLQLLGPDASAFVRFEDDSIFRQVNQELDVQLLPEITEGINGESLTNFDGQQIVVFDGINEVLFEFDTDGILNLVPFDTNQVAVNVADDSSQRELVQALLDAFEFANLDVTAFGATGVFRIRGNGGPISITSPTGGAFVTGNSSIGVSPGFGLQIPTTEGLMSLAVQDGQSFSIGLGLAAPTTFELDFDGFLNNPDAVAVPLLNAGFDTPPDDLANAIVAAIRPRFPTLNATNAGAGRVTLGTEPDVQLNTAGTILSQIGSPGDGPSSPVVIRYTDPANTVAAAFANAATAAGVDATLNGDRVLLRTTGTPQGDAVVTNFIADNAGNRLQPASERVGSRVEILVGDLFDYGDAAVITNTGGTYATTIQTDGPRHQITDDLYLGSGVTEDVNGGNDDGDVDDGVTIRGTLQPGFSTQFDVSLNQIFGTNTNVAASQPFFLDVWFDWNRDGNFNAASEVTRFGSFGTGLRVIDEGINTFSINVPSIAQVGEVQGRFRLSYESNLPATGFAEGGEVEDYTFEVVNNPFQSSRDNEDVNDSGAVTPLDALLLINMLNQAGSSIDLTNVPAGVDLPAFPDVDGNGSVTPVDVLRVINRLNSITGPGLDPNAEPLGTSRALGNLTAQAEPLARGSAVYQSVTDGVMASPTTIAFDPTRSASVVETESGNPGVTSVEAPSSKTSVFDSPAEMQLDSIVDSLAADREEATKNTKSDQTDEGNSTVDEFFASMG